MSRFDRLEDLLHAHAARALEQNRIAGPPCLPSAQRLEELLKTAVETGRPGTRIPDQQVASDGAISIPYAGRVAAAGRTPGAVLPA